MSAAQEHVFLCNGAEGETQDSQRAESQARRLDYRAEAQQRNVRIALPDFVRRVFHLRERVLDLLEIAAYVFAADRLTSRGARDALEYQSWSRSFRFVVRVRDYEFWQAPEVKDALSAALRYMSGDRSFSFAFEPGHSTPPTSLFDREEFAVAAPGAETVALFSGGIDSTVGAVEHLETTDKHICLVSHQSQPQMKRTQNRVAQALAERYPGRVDHYKFECTLARQRAVDENQRTRAFLYCCIAYAICSALSQHEFLVFENGVTALNFPKREDMQNARASRTAHPKTIALLEKLFSIIDEHEFTIGTPYLWKTKTDVINQMVNMKAQNLLPSTVSCSKTFKNLGSATHCGGCPQCIDRVIACYASNLQDPGAVTPVAMDIIREPVEDHAPRTSLVDYVRQARNFAQWNIDHFEREMMVHLPDITEALPGMRHTEVVERVFDLCQRHGNHVRHGINRMRDCHEDIYEELPEGSLLRLVSSREHLKTPVERIVADICALLQSAVPLAFRSSPPKDEADFNDKVSAFLSGCEEKLRREHPTVRFACADARPDLSLERVLFIECKYVRKGMTPSKVTEGMAADMTKYGEVHILFVVYDPNHRISDDEEFRQSFERRGRCTVLVIH